MRGIQRAGLGALVASLAAIAVPAAHAATFTVSNTNDGGAGSLRQALTNANTNGTGLDTIAFADTVAGTIDLQSALPNVDTDLDLNGPGANVLTVRRDAGGQYGILRVLADRTVSASGLTLSNGDNFEDGGGVRNEGTLTLERVAVRGNTAAFGGGIYNETGATLIVRESLVSANAATGDAGQSPAAGIDSAGSLAIEASTIADNPGIGVTVAADGATIDGSTLAGNVDANLVSLDLASTQVKSTILADASGAATNCLSVAGTVVSQGYNLADDASCNLGATGDQASMDPQLGPLQDNGGPTKTMAIPLSSPATDRGTSALIGGGGASGDQRGKPRPVDLPTVPNGPPPDGDGADVGAYERERDNTRFVFVVRNRNDSGFGSLREAITGANAVGEPASVVFAKSSAGTIDLQSALPSLANDMTVRGLGANRSVIRRDGGGDYRIISVGSVTVTLSRLALVNGSAPTDFGGGLHNAAGGTVTLDRIAVHGNSAGLGGGIHNTGTLTVRKSTISGNVAGDAGGGINANAGQLTVEASTITGNSVVGFGGGGIAIGLSTAAVSTSTVAGNSAANAANLANLFNGPITLTNTIVADPLGGGENCAGVTSLGFNLADDGSCALAATGDQPSVDPQLGPLQDNGGPTRTMAIPLASPAIDGGRATDVDQRGLFRRVDFLAIDRPAGGNNADIGAYELQGPNCNGEPSRIIAAPGVTTFAPGGNNVIAGTTGPDEIHAGAGNDAVCGFAGADQLSGDAGVDFLNGGGGTADVCDGGTETDTAINCETQVGIP